MFAELNKLVSDVASKPTLKSASASFMRDYLRTLLVRLSADAEAAVKAMELEEQLARAGRASEGEELTGGGSYFKALPEELTKHVFSFLDGETLALARGVCKKWNKFACEDYLWKRLCLKRWRSLERDPALWSLIADFVRMDDPARWRKIYPQVAFRQQWRCRLQKTGRFICQLVAHHVAGAPIGDQGLPYTLVVERRFNILHLQSFVLPDAAVLYFEPETEEDRAGYEEFIDYLTKRTRAGLALEDQRRFIFIPPCEYSKSLNYHGNGLLGVVQNAYPPLAP